jgi:hypothetical protein
MKSVIGTRQEKIMNALVKPSEIKYLLIAKQTSKES